MPFKAFIFERYGYDQDANEAWFEYSFDGELTFRETVSFSAGSAIGNQIVFDEALFLAFMISGISYYKAFPVSSFVVKPHGLTKFQADFFNTVYLHGLSQYIFENKLLPSQIARFEVSDVTAHSPTSYEHDATLVLQSGGKDSLLLAELLKAKGQTFSAWYMTSHEGMQHPDVIDRFDMPLRMVKRTIDIDGLQKVSEQGGLNGHVPVTYITLSYALLDALLHEENTVLAAIGHEGEEPHAVIDGLDITHQWSKTWPAEKMYNEYVQTVISPDLVVGSPLRAFSELKIAQLFTEYAWEKYASSFSSCNVANYKQGHSNQTLTWCGHCPKCANSYLLFAPFIARNELNDVIGSDLFQDETLTDTFKGLLSIDGMMKPFECVGEVDELRLAYHMAMQNGYDPLPFEVPSSDFDIDHRYEASSLSVL